MLPQHRESAICSLMMVFGTCSTRAELATDLMTVVPAAGMIAENNGADIAAPHGYNDNHLLK